jgi:D-glycero-alpha-D-manno-heptose-7-phosphate kinase
MESKKIIISRTPVRISFFGGGTDYIEYYFRNKGAILGATINNYVYISINQMGSFFGHKIRVGYSRTELVNNANEILHPSVRECLKYHNLNGNLDIHIFSDLPSKTGLGSSSSFTVGLLNALYALKNKTLTKQQLANEACFIEQQKIQENVGSQDQFHAAFGGLNIIEFNQKEISVRSILLADNKRKLLEKSVMVFYTGLTRFANEIVKEQIEKTKSLSNDSYLSKMYEMVFEAEDILKNFSDDLMIEKLGILLHQSWLLKKKLSSKISNSKIDLFYSKALKTGAIGGKLCGAGSGGFLTLIVPESKQANVRAMLKDLYEIPFQIENEGSKIIYKKE